MRELEDFHRYRAATYRLLNDPRLPLAGVYFLKCGQFVKIGYASNLMHRLCELQGGNPHRLVPQYLLPEPPPIEKALHRLFAAERHRAEWFRDTGELRSFLKHLRLAGVIDAVRLISERTNPATIAYRLIQGPLGELNSNGV